MSVPVDLDQLCAACEWVSAGEAAAVDAGAYLPGLRDTVRT